MQDPFFATRTRDRCHRSLEGQARTMSRFNTQCLCEACAAQERRHPDHRKACDAEMEAVRNGGRNFEGVGWPGNGSLK